MTTPDEKPPIADGEQILRQRIAELKHALRLMLVRHGSHCRCDACLVANAELEKYDG